MSDPAGPWTKIVGGPMETEEQKKQYSEAAERAWQGWKCQRGEHQAIPSGYSTVQIHDEHGVLRYAFVCRFCRCLFVEKP